MPFFLKHLCSVILCVGLTQVLLAQCPQPKPGIQFCGTDEFCASDSVCIDITADPGSQFSYFLVDWNFDGTYDDTVFQTGTYYHVYNLGGGCQEPIRQTIEVKGVNVCGAITQEASVAAFITIVTPPRINSIFNQASPSTLCCPNHTTQPIFTGCPSDVSVTNALWDFGVGTPSTSTALNPPAINFPPPPPSGFGAYPITLRLETIADGKICGVAELTDTLYINEPPVANDSLIGDLNPATDSMLFCLGTPAIFLNTSRFANDTSLWTLSPSTGYSIVQINEDSLVIRFTQAGVYTLLIDAFSIDCGNDRFTQTIVVEEPPAVDFRVNPVIDCNPITISPGDSLPTQPAGVSLSWDLGVFGSTTGPNPGTFTYTASDRIIVLGSNLCGVRSDTLSLQLISPATAQLSVPSTISRIGDTIYLCQSDTPFNVLPQPLGGMFSGGITDPNGRIDPIGISTNSPQLIQYGSSCINPDSLYVVVQDFPISFVIDSIQCEDGNPISFTATHSSNGNGAWSGGNYLNANGTFSPNLAGTGSWPIRYIVQDTAFPAGCTYTYDFTIQVINPVVQLTVDTCQFGSGTGTTVLFDATGTSPGLTPQIDYGDNSPFGNQLSHTYQTGGTYTVRAWIEAQGCTDSISLTIQVDEPPIPSFSSNPSREICVGDSLTILNTSTGGQATTSWYLNGSLWSQPTDSFRASLPASLQFQDTLHLVELRAEGTCGEAYYRDTIRVKPGVAARFGVFPQQTCAGDTVRFNQVSLGVPTTFAWYENDSLISTSVQLPDRILPAGNYAYRLEVANACQVDTLTKQVQVLPVDVTAFAELNQTQLCLGDTLFAESFSTPFAFNEWRFGDGSQGNGLRITHVYQDTGIYRLQLFARGCGVDSVSIPVEVYPLPVPTLTHDPEGCEGDEVSIALGTAGARYALQVGDLTYRNKPATVLLDTAGTLALTLFDTTSVGCSALIRSNIRVNPRPTAGFEFDSPVCERTVTDFRSLATGDIFNTVWQWGDGNTATGLMPSHAYDSAGRYPVTQTVVSSFGCEDITQRIVDVQPSPNALFVSDMQPICASTEAFGFTNLTPENQPLTYQWDFGNSDSSSLTNPQTAYPIPGTYPVRLVATNAPGCTDMYVDSVTVYPQTRAEILLDTGNTCAPMEVGIRIAPSPYTNLEFIIDSTFSRSDSVFTESFGDVQNGHQIVLELSFNGICVSSDTAYVFPVVRPEALFVADKTAVRTGKVAFTNRSQNATHYLWNFGDGLSSRLTDPVHQYDSAGTYRVVLYAFNGNSCVDSTETEVTFSPRPYVFVPSAFTPNGDGQNDEFYIVSKKANIVDITIFDRWGTKHFMTTDPAGRWAGVLRNGSQAPEGVYVCVVRYRRQGEVPLESNMISETHTITLYR